MLYIYYENNIYVYIVENLKKQIINYGINVEITRTISENNISDLYVIFGMHDFHSPIVSRNYIVYQLEQSSGNPESNYFNEKYIDFMKKARSVWDYSLVNYQYLETLGIRAEYKPIYPLYDRREETNADNHTNKEEKSSDFIFVGIMNERRNKIINILKDKGYSVLLPTGLYGDEFARALRSSKFALNIHYFKESILETVRLSTMLEYGCKIISEVSVDPILDADYSQYTDNVFMTTYDEYVDKCVSLIENTSAHSAHHSTMSTMSALNNKKTDYESSLRRYDYLFSGEIKEEDIPFVVECKKDTINGSLSLFVPVIQDSDLPKVSIVTPTYNRSNIFPFAVNNFRAIAYPKNKIEWIIVNDSSEEEMKKYKIPKESNIAHYKLKTTGPLTIGHKRNFGIERSSGEYIVFMDDDDYYYPDSVYNRIALMLYYKKPCIGTTKLDIHDIVNNKSARINRELFSEASLAFKRTFWNEKHFNENFHNLGEGYDFCLGRKNKIIDMPSAFNIIAMTHKNNFTGSGRSLSHNNNNSHNSNNSQSLLSILPKDVIKLIKGLFK